MSKEEKHGWFARLHDRFLGAEHEHGRFEVRPTAESHFFMVADQD